MPAGWCVPAVAATRRAPRRSARPWPLSCARVSRPASVPSEANRAGWVALVGAGPGHPGLLTLRGKERLSQASVVVHDRLISSELLGHAPASARRIYVGKGPREHAVSQDGINDLLIE